MNALDHAKRVVRIVVGFTILAIGVAMLVLPGPGWVAIAIALAILAAEFTWAKRLLDRLKNGANRLNDAAKGFTGRRGG